MANWSIFHEVRSLRTSEQLERANGQLLELFACFLP
jgi:hypothetical protein